MEKKTFHDSRMNLCRWLKDNTNDGHTYYTYGKRLFLIPLYAGLQKQGQIIYKKDLQ